MVSFSSVEMSKMRLLFSLEKSGINYPLTLRHPKRTNVQPLPILDESLRRHFGNTADVCTIPTPIRYTNISTELLSVYSWCFLAAIIGSLVNNKLERMFFLEINQLDAQNLLFIKNQSSLNLCTGRPPIGVMIPEAV